MKYDDIKVGDRLRVSGSGEIITVAIKDDITKFIYVDTRYCNAEELEPLTRELPPKEAIQLMLDGRTLYYENGLLAHFNGFTFVSREVLDKGKRSKLTSFHNLYAYPYEPDPPPTKKKRLMTRWECLAWAQSNDAKGWVVKHCVETANQWASPIQPSYSGVLENYHRARFDTNGIIAGTECGFEVEEDA
jgi:hypothetical protein